MLHWAIIFGCFVFQGALSAALVFPRSPLFVKKTIISYAVDTSIHKFAKVYLTVVGVLCGETLFELLTAKPPKDPEEYHHFVNDNVVNQRNIIVGMSSVLLFFFLYYVSLLTKENQRMAFDTETLKKQASNVSNEYMRLLKEKEGPTNDSKEDPVAALKKENASLKEKVEDLNKELKKSKQEVEVVKKQAESQQTAFLELMDKNKSLQNRLDDFNVVFGETQKKNV